VVELIVRAERREDCVVLTVAGELDLSTVGELHSAVSAELGADPVDLVLDLAEVGFVDSSGLGALLRIRAEQLARGVTMRIAAVAPGPARVIGIAGLADTFGLPSH
jgi:anti-anti-sigma factor